MLNQFRTHFPFPVLRRFLKTAGREIMASSRIYAVISVYYLFLTSSQALDFVEYSSDYRDYTGGDEQHAAGKLKVICIVSLHRNKFGRALEKDGQVVRGIMRGVFTFIFVRHRASILPLLFGFGPRFALSGFEETSRRRR